MKNPAWGKWVTLGFAAVAAIVLAVWQIDIKGMVCAEPDLSTAQVQK